MKVTKDAVAPGQPPREAVQAYVGMGANLGDAAAALQKALTALRALPLTQVTAVSSMYSSAPVDASGPDYLNAVVALHTALGPMALLGHLQAIEIDMGRERPFRNAPRTLDLDLLRYGEATINAPTLTVPHPRMHERAFVLQPLFEVAPHRVPLEALNQVASQRIQKNGPFG